MKVLLLASLIFLFSSLNSLPSALAKIERVSVSSSEGQSNGASSLPTVTPDGRYVVYYSKASNLVANDTNIQDDAFLRDRALGTTERVSIGPGATQGNGPVYNPVGWDGPPTISTDGRYVAFASSASNHVVGDLNFYPDVFVRDRTAGAIRAVDVTAAGMVSRFGLSYYSSISSNGQKVAFFSVAPDLTVGPLPPSPLIYARDIAAGSTDRVSVLSSGALAFGQSGQPAISGNGRFVVFASMAHLVTNDINPGNDIFLHDLVTHKTTLVSVSSAGVQGNGGSISPAISSDGRYVAFGSIATNLVLNDTNGVRDYFVRDRQTGKTERVSVGTGGVQTNGHSAGGVSISPDGRYVAFASSATNIGSTAPSSVNKLFFRDRNTGRTRFIGLGTLPSIASNAKAIAFVSGSDALVPGDNNNKDDIFVWTP